MAASTETQLQSASRESLADAVRRLDAVVDSSAGADLAILGDDLFAVERLLESEPALRRHLADPAVAPEARTELARRLLEGKIGAAALDLVSTLVSARWSRSIDLLDALEALARRAVLGVAEKDGSLDEVEDQLFRFGRILDREPQLARLLADRSTPADKRVGLLSELLRGKASTVTTTLLEQAVRSPRGLALDIVAGQLAELAAARRDRYVAHVRSAVALTDQQEQRLTESLGRLYGRPISLQVEHDPEILGGLVVQVGGELIDGSVAGRLAAARRGLPT
ncbi:F0F1 ATP synthase subunit delta [Pseudonocardia dioxanivorans]|uniref:ATP synthase subunit delta n=1 Tax=Pseudonocardia dioxanivorans (strain ATCC 55486 / DSM 44775 / JCM 13855 / CB1190) TaxID=675635 RepID=F4CJ67_PSEUX|nr:F0F1 ATP synthase subunit delta [Pseudonocardia dioxanivorans]AEA23917.1 ATP synthase subunit delta [Pseudonocardia dioxanivorans CB1190]